MIAEDMRLVLLTEVVQGGDEGSQNLFEYEALDSLNCLRVRSGKNGSIEIAISAVDGEQVVYTELGPKSTALLKAFLGAM